MQTVLNLAILGITLLLMVTVGLELEVRDFREIGRRKGVLCGALLLLPGAGGRRMAADGASDSIIVGIVVAARNVSLATAIAVMLLDRIEFAVFAAVYFLTEVPLLLGVAFLRRGRGAASETAAVGLA